MIEAFIFDIDGTLLDHKGTQRKSLETYHASQPAPLRGVPLDEFIDVWIDETERYMELYFRRKVGHDEARVKRVQAIFRRFGHELGEEEALSVFLTVYRLYIEGWTLFDDAIPTLDELKDRPLGILSNGNGVSQGRKLDRMRLRGRFKAVAISDDIGTAKPEADAFLHIASELGVEPANAAYVGDVLEVDALGAKGAGMTGVWIDRENGGNAPAGIIRITTLRDFAPSLKRAGLL